MSNNIPGRVQSLVFALGSAKQANISTVSSTLNRFRKLDMGIPFGRPNTETDKDEIGKGNEFITQVFKTSKDVSGRIEKFGSAEFVLWSWGYALGKVTLATGLYTIVPIDPTLVVELPYTSVVAQFSSGGFTVFDEALLGVAIESVETVLNYGPNRASVRTNVDYVGSGIVTASSGITVPATLVEDYMLGSSAAITINGVNYVSAKTALNVTMGWRNNLVLPMRYFLGSGLDADGFATGARIFIGNRVPTLSFTVFLTSASAEYAALVAQTTGTAVITLTYDATHFVTWTWHSVSFEMIERTNEEGLVAVTVTCAPKSDATLGVVDVTGKCAITDIAQ